MGMRKTTPLLFLIVLCCGSIIADDKHDQTSLGRILMAARRSHSTGEESAARPSRELLLQALRTVYLEVEALQAFGDLPRARSFGDDGFRATDTPGPVSTSGTPPPSTAPTTTTTTTTTTEQSPIIPNLEDIIPFLPKFNFPKPSWGRRRRELSRDESLEAGSRPK